MVDDTAGLASGSGSGSDGAMERWSNGGGAMAVERWSDGATRLGRDLELERVVAVRLGGVLASDLAVELETMECVFERTIPRADDCAADSRVRL